MNDEMRFTPHFNLHDADCLTGNRNPLFDVIVNASTSVNCKLKWLTVSRVKDYSCHRPVNSDNFILQESPVIADKDRDACASVAQFLSNSSV